MDFLMSAASREVKVDFGRDDARGEVLAGINVNQFGSTDATDALAAKGREGGDLSKGCLERGCRRESAGASSQDGGNGSKSELHFEKCCQDRLDSMIVG